LCRGYIGRAEFGGRAEASNSKSAKAVRLPYRCPEDFGISFSTSCHSLGGQRDISLESISP
jgi:hypothetical protein